MKQLISIIGPTAVGKTALSLKLAKQYQTEIVSTDSRQIYRGMNIGTAKPSSEELAEVSHHFIDHLPPTETYNAGSFEQEADPLLLELHQNSDCVISVGGSTLYINALWNGIDPMPKIPAEVRTQLRDEWDQNGLAVLLEELKEVDPNTYEKIDQQNPVRILRALEVYRASGTPISVFRQQRKIKAKNYQLLKIGLTDDRAALYERINQRVEQMFANGLKQEVEQLLDQGISPEAQSLQSIGYREIVQSLAGKHDLSEAKRLIKRNSRRYAKRQMTWFRRDQEIQWFQAGDDQAVLDWLAK
ncbi:MAG: tRNA (adenosine(37)-N6)-dimethylallyltransferase MiaA [Bacteroidota bacterium]